MMSEQPSQIQGKQMAKPPKTHNGIQTAEKNAGILSDDTGNMARLY